MFPEGFIGSGFETQVLVSLHFWLRAVALSILFGFGVRVQGIGFRGCRNSKPDIPASTARHLADHRHALGGAEGAELKMKMKNGAAAAATCLSV